MRTGPARQGFVASALRCTTQAAPFLRRRVKRLLGTPLELVRNPFGERWQKGVQREQETDTDRKEVKEMMDKSVERRHQVAAIKEGARTVNDGRSYLLPGLWACRLASGLTQRELAGAIGSNQGTVRELERLERGAYIKTIRRLCRALEVCPEDLLCRGSPQNKRERR